jgi:BON domain
MSRHSHSTGERHNQRGQREQNGQRGRSADGGNQHVLNADHDVRESEERDHGDSRSQSDSRSAGNFNDLVEDYRGQQTPNGFQGKGFFGSGQEVPFERTQPHIGTGHGIGYGPGANPPGRGYRGLGPKGYQRSDERLLEEVNERLTEHDDLDASEISVSVEKSEVTLNGTVNSRDEKRLAEDLADDVSGVEHVQNNLRVQKQKAK